MTFSRVSFYHFRNLLDDDVRLGGKTIFLTGNNGQGKTNFLESLYLLCYGTSFRTRKDGELVAIPEKEMSIHGDLKDDENQDMSISLKYARDKKDITVNGKKINDRKELVENIPCILFAHEDMAFIQGGPERKRWFLNQTMTLLNPEAIELVRQYQKVLQLRNACLKTGAVNLLDLYNLQLSQAGLILMRERQKIIEELNVIFSDVYNKVTGFTEPVYIQYHPSWKNAASVEDMVAILEKKREQDREYCITTTGPHRDSFRLLQEGADYLTIASTGQLRLAILVLRIAQALLLSGNARRKPVLLFDDVLLELDLTKKKKIIGFLPDYDQAFFTFLPDEYKSFMALEDVLTLKVADGKFSEVPA